MIQIQHACYNMFVSSYKKSRHPSEYVVCRRQSWLWRNIWCASCVSYILNECYLIFRMLQECYRIIKESKNALHYSPPCVPYIIILCLLILKLLYYSYTVLYLLITLSKWLPYIIYLILLILKMLQHCYIVIRSSNILLMF